MHVYKRRQRDRIRERVIASRRYKDVRWRLGKADAGALSFHINISEGIVEESARKQKGFISTGWQNQGLMFGGRSLLLLLLFPPKLLTRTHKDEWLSGFHCVRSFLAASLLKVLLHMSTHSMWIFIGKCCFLQFWHVCDLRGHQKDQNVIYLLF